MWTMFGRLQSAMNLVAALIIVGLMALISVDVIGRAAFSMPLYGVPEITKFAIICMVWLQMAFTLRTGGHLRSTLILDRLPVGGRRAVLALNSLVGAGVMALIAWYGWPELVRAYQLGVFEGEHPVRVPVWPIWAVLVLGAAATATEYLGQAVLALLGKADTAAAPPAVIE